MYFDPLSAWLVTLIADGIIIAGEKSRGGSAAEYNQQRVKQANNMLNGDIRRVRSKYGLDLPELAYEQIQLHVRVTKKSFSFQYAHGQIEIDLDNQEYIIALLEACAESYSKYSYDEAVNKTQWYKNAAIEARRRKELYAKELEETRIREAKQREKDQTMSNIYLVVGLIIFVAFIIFFFS